MAFYIRQHLIRCGRSIARDKRLRVSRAFVPLPEARQHPLIAREQVQSNSAMRSRDLTLLLCASKAWTSKPSALGADRLPWLPRNSRRSADQLFCLPPMSAKATCWPSFIAPRIARQHGASALINRGKHKWRGGGARTSEHPFRIECNTQAAWTGIRVGDTQSRDFHGIIHGHQLQKLHAQAMHVALVNRVTEPMPRHMRAF